jgi:hypothetical protein
MKFVAVKGPSGSAHDNITHEDARKEEREFFTNPAWSSIPESSYSTDSLMAELVDRYIRAMEGAQGPINDDLIYRRIGITRALAVLPEQVNAHKQFVHMWATVSSEQSDLVQNDKITDDTLKHPANVIYKLCSLFSTQLLGVPLKIAQPQGDGPKANLKILTAIIAGAAGITLSNFNPFPPLEVFYKSRAETHLKAGVGKLIKKLNELLETYVEAIVDHIMAAEPNRVMFESAFKLIHAELSLVVGRIVFEMSERLYDIGRVWYTAMIL